MSRNERWLREAKWGVFIHYLAAPAGTEPSPMTAEAWNRRVDAVDVERLAAQLATVSAGYCFLTVGQNSGHFCAGIVPSKCSRRDLITDLHRALAARGIALGVYATNAPPACEPETVARFGWEWGYEGDWPRVDTPRTGRRLAEFQRKWEAVLRDWSLRWGNRVSAWWIDGCYFADAMYRFPEPPNFESLAGALRAGNPDALVAFNGGGKIAGTHICEVPLVRMSPCEDFTAGEIDGALPVGDVHNGGMLPLPSTVDGAQWHALSFLGQTWGVGPPRFPEELAAGYTKFVAQHGGAVTWDVPTDNGVIPDDFLRQLAAIGRAARGARCQPQLTPNHFRHETR
jgi:hypothetical protein